MVPRRPYFFGSNRVRTLLNQLHLWRGTRWQHAGARPNQMRCGVSGDCLFWVHVFKAIGALPKNLEIPDYRVQEALADKMQTLRSRIEGTRRALLVWQRPSGTWEGTQRPGGRTRDSFGGLSFPLLFIGDVLLFKNGASGAHCGLVVRETPVHFTHLTGNGLLEEPLHQAHYLAGLTFVYRLLEAEPEDL